MNLMKQSAAAFTEQLASSSAVPGGGSASALVGAIGIALGDMVGELTVGKPKYASVEQDIRTMMAHAQELRVRFLACAEKDAEAFLPLSRAYRIPKDDPTRADVMEECLRGAAAVPMEIMELCCEAIALLSEFAEKGSRLAVSDAVTGMALCLGALYGSAANVKANTKLMSDRAFANRLNAQADSRLAEYRAAAERILKSMEDDTSDG